MSPTLTMELAQSHTAELRRQAAQSRLVHLATRCCSSAPVRAARATWHAVAAAPGRTLHWLRAGQLAAPCSC